MQEHLLRPSLAGADQPAPRLYSTQSSFLVAFIGGPAAIVLYSALNSWRLRRPVDTVAYIVTLALVVALMLDGDSGGPVFSAFVGYFGTGSERYLWRLLSLAAFGAFYLMHRKQHRSAQLFGDKPPSPWIAGIACIAGGYGLMMVLQAVTRTLA